MSANLNIRPRIRQTIPLSQKELEERFQLAAASQDLIKATPFVMGHSTFKINQQRSSYWTPELHISLEETEEGTIIRGLFGPKPQVWTLFVLFYSIIGLAITIIGLYGLSLLFIENDAPILWTVPILVLLLLSIYATSWYGKKLGSHEIELLSKFFNKTLEKP